MIARSIKPATADTGGTATLSTQCTGYPVPTVQWQVAPKGSSTFTNVSGLTGATVTFPVNASMNGNIYRAVISTGGPLGTVDTNAVKLSVNNRSVVSNDLVNLARESSAAIGAINTCAKVVQQEGRTLLADLRRLKGTAAQKALVTTLETTDATHRHTLLLNEARTLAVTHRDAVRVNALHAQLQKHPTNTVLQTDLTAALAALQADAAANTVPTDATRCNLGVVGSLAPISAAYPHDPKIQTDVGVDQGESDNIGQTLAAPTVTVLALVSQIESDA